MERRARLMKLLSGLTLFAVFAASASIAAGGPVSWWLKGWPWSPGPLSLLPGPTDQAVLAYQPNGPSVVLVEGPAPGDDGGVLLAEDTSIDVNALGAVGPLTGNLTPRAKAAILLEPYSGQVLYAKNEHEQRAIASVTKIMTLNIIFDALESGRVNLTDQVVASENAAGYGGSQIWLEPGEVMSLSDLLIAVAVGSANDACVAVAEHICGTEERFVEEMNAKALELGMKDTHFNNCHGLDDPNHYSSAYDVALMSRYAVQRPELLKLTSTWIEYLRNGALMQSNNNKLVRYYQGCDGLKTGWTTAATSGHCLSATAVRDDTRLIAVVLGCPDSKIRFSEASSLLNAGFASVIAVPLAKQGEAIEQVHVERGALEDVTLTPARDFGVVLPKGQTPDLERRIEREERIFAPVQKGQVLGQLIVEAGGKEVGRCDLVADRDVPRANLFRLIWKALSCLIRRD